MKTKLILLSAFICLSLSSKAQRAVPIYDFETKLWGFVDSSSLDTLIPCMFSRIGPLEEGSWSVKRGDRYGRVNLQGDTFIPVKYSSTSVYPDVGIQVRRGYVRMLGLDGDTLLPNAYRQLQLVHDSLWIAKSHRNFTQLVDFKGNVFLNDTFISMDRLSYTDLFMVKKMVMVDTNLRLLEGVIDKHGNQILPYQNGMILGANGDQQSFTVASRTGLDNEFFFYSLNGDLLFKHQFERKGVHSMYKNKFLSLKLNGSYVLKNLVSDSIIASGFEKTGHPLIGNFPMKKGGKWGVVDTLGNIKVPFIYDEIQLQAPPYYKMKFGEYGLLAAHINGKIHLFDASMNRVNEEAYSTLHGFWFSTSYVSRDGQHGLINLKGEELIPCIYEAVHRETDELVWVKANGLWGLADTSGSVLVKPQFKYIGAFNEWGYCAVQVNEKWGILNLKGEMVVEPIYDNIRKPQNGYFNALLDGKQLLLPLTH